MDEEAAKRNTDCVYFLASPLTCKKGANCEYRHSEAARLHPRDCWYWLGGNCLNAKCPFRHPPLDGRPASLGTASSTPSKAVTATSVSTISSPVPANKAKTPCYFFSQGFCTKGNRCAFLHGSLAIMGQPAAIAQKVTEASFGKESETKDKSMNLVAAVNGTSIPKLPEASISVGLEIKDKPINFMNHLFTQTSMSKFGVGIASAPTLPSHVFIRAQNTSLTKNDVPPLYDLSSKSSNVQIPILKRSNSFDLHGGDRSVYGNIQAPSNSLSNLPESLDRGQSKEQRQQQPKFLDGWEVKMVRSAETKQLSQRGRVSEGIWREGLLNDVYPGFVEDKSDETVYREVNKRFPCFNSGACSPRRTYCNKDAHDFEQAGSELSGMPYSLEFESYNWPKQLNSFDCQQSFSKSRGRHYNGPYLTRLGEHNIKDLRERLSKRRISDQDQFSDFDGHTGAFGDHELSDERDLVDSMESGPSEIEQETSWRKFKRAVRRRVQLPNHDFGWDAGSGNAEISSGSSPLMYLASDLPRNKPYFGDGGWYSSRRPHLELDRGRSLQTRLGSRVNRVDDFQDADEFCSGSCSSYVACPSRKSRILSAAGSDGGQVVEVLNNFEGPKPLSVLLQAKRQGK